jgi:hypothetical protein
MTAEAVAAEGQTCRAHRRRGEHTLPPGRRRPRPRRRPGPQGPRHVARWVRAARPDGAPRRVGRPRATLRTGSVVGHLRARTRRSRP